MLLGELGRKSKHNYIVEQKKGNFVSRNPLFKNRE